MKNIVIGTAGHVDHGKTTLVKALTGIDTDRLKEEKERGMTIEPGFAHLRLSSGNVVSVVDVPGHERFIKNMLRGISEVDAAILVVAADDGVMPQTREHFDILKLLGIERGVIVLSKIDLVDKEILNMAIEEVTKLIQGTFLEDAPLHLYSSKTGEGIEDIKTSIERIVQEISGKDNEGIFRLPIDRVFTLRGYGTVATGTIVSGKITRGSEIEICPLGLRANVRTIQIHNRSIDEASAGQRVGLNLSNVKVETLERGMVLSEPNCLITTYMINGKFHYLKCNSKPLKDRIKIKLYSGTSEVIARMVLMGKKSLSPGESSFVQFRLANKLCFCPHDRYIIRSLSPIATMGGGTILEVNSPKYKLYHKDTVQNLEIMEKRKNRETIEMFIRKERFRPVTLLELSKKLNLVQSEIESVFEALVRENRILFGEDHSVIHRDAYEGLREEIPERLRKFHEMNPLRSDVSQEEVRSKISSSISLRLFETVLEELQKEGVIIRQKGKIELAGSRTTLTSKQRIIYDELDRICKGYRFRPLPTDEFKRIKSRYGEQDVDVVLGFMIGERKLVKLKNHRLIHSESIEELKRILKEHIEKRGQITLAESMDVLGIGRTQIAPVYEHLDSIRFTMRVGDYRVLRKSAERENKCEEKHEIRVS